MYKLLKINLLISIVLLFTSAAKSQNTLLYTDEDLNYKKGVELFEKEKYAQAQHFLNQAVDYYGSEHTDIKADAEYYLALCAIELFNTDAEYRISQFIANYPESPRTRVAYFDMAKFKYRNKKYDEALLYFDKVWKQNLTDEQLNEFYFKKGYCYFKENELEKSSKTFFEILDKDTKYAGPANYYYAHVAYLDENYETALNGFIKLKDDKTFAPIVPYYIVQIYYLQGKSDKVLEYGPQLLDQPKTKREAEISRVVGEALYAKEQYQESLEYLEKYKKKADKYTREDIYQLGYVYYMTGEYNESVTTFSNITNVEDGLTQNAYFHMADCYLKLDMKDQARMAFQAASRLNYNEDIKEISLLNYAKLSYELSYSPFNETINAFYDYITEYPKSIHHDEAYSYLVKVYLTSKNYKEALISLEKIKVKSPEMLAAHQRVAFYRGLELFNNLQFSGALAAFEITLQQRNFDKQLNSLAIYWKAEVLYRLEHYSEAFDFYNQFLLTPGAYLLDEYNNSYYNMGYCSFKNKNYSQAISWFRKYTDKGAEVDIVKRGDAFIRIADSYFVGSQYKSAVEYYNEAIVMDTFDVDYAIFQKGFSYGLLKQHQKKIETLSLLINQKSNVSYAADALYERGRSFIALDSVDLAIADFDLMLSEHPNSIYIVKTLLHLGLLNYSKNENELALKSYKRVVIDYPGTQEASNAMLGIKNIYVDMNKVDDYFAFAKEQGGENITVNEKDSLTYLAAEKIYMSGNWKMASTMFNSYLNEYTNGKFALNAHYYSGDCNLKANRFDSALTDYNFVLERPKNIFTEVSMLSAANLYAEKGEDSIAYTIYNKLENQAEIKSNLIIARKGQMDAAFKIKNFDAAIEASRRVLITDKVQEEDVRKARMVMGKSFIAQNLLDAGIIQFRILAQDIKNIEGAESKYLVTEILSKQGKSDEAEEVINEFINAGTPHQFWLAKAFLLLSDIYWAKGDGFQAKANLQSVIANYSITNDGIIKQATAKLDEIITLENQQFEIKESADTK
ncbi:MAG: tetratricopeptide repeat protein [Salinivirgaceae bacterium]|nr:tetratricopeptide repeat protein [Salinivirgaceae bacterium]